MPKPTDAKETIKAYTLAAQAEQFAGRIGVPVNYDGELSKEEIMGIQEKLGMQRCDGVIDSKTLLAIVEKKVEMNYNQKP